MSEKNFDETMEMVENRIKESQASREGVELSNLEVSADGVLEKSPDAAVSKALEQHKEIEEKIEAAGGIETVISSLPEDESQWTPKIQESLKKQSRAGNSGFGGGNGGFQNAAEEWKQGYYIVRRWLESKFK